MLSEAVIFKKVVAHIQDSDTAYKVGKRKSKEPAILIIQAKKAQHNGITFYKGNDFVWLADSVPPNYIEKRGQ